ncbi:putative F-box associated interaction domain-containing protein [Medicago truncatula]|nr:putative F-box associated interaction domain-containing protein [Medicago truncatula]
MRKHHCFVVGSCNGLLCVCQSHSFPPPRVRLYNPCIKFKSKKSPKSPWLDRALTHYGFGYDQVNDSYEVLVVVRNNNDYLTILYTFEEDS